MPLPQGFRFSQASLQDFVDCPRRFQLRYIKALRWPAVEAEPVEKHEQRLALGQTFHQMVQQHVLGVPEARILGAEPDPDLQRWWQNYLLYRPQDSFGATGEGSLVRCEHSLMGQAGGYRLVAKYDLLVVEPGKRGIIFDWKTGAKRAPEHFLRDHLQTRVYPYLLVEAGSYLNGGVPLEPEQVELIYWFPEFPDAPARLPYSADKYEADGAYLTKLIARIEGLGEEAFALADDVRHCTYCLYRSYCGRGVEAGSLADVTAAWALQEQADDLQIDLEQVAEIEF